MLARCSAQNQRQDVMIVFQQGAFLVQPQRPDIGQSLGIHQNQKWQWRWNFHKKQKKTWRLLLQMLEELGWNFALGALLDLHPEDKPDDQVEDTIQKLKILEGCLRGRKHFASHEYNHVRTRIKKYILAAVVFPTRLPEWLIQSDPLKNIVPLSLLQTPRKYLCSCQGV